MSPFRASGASTGKRAKAQRFCLRCEEPVFGAGKNCDICGKPAERFDSKAEYNHFHKLRLRKMAGEIFALRCHPKFDLNVRSNDNLTVTHIGTFSPDFSYARKDPYYPDGVTVYDEIKPHRKGKNGVNRPILTREAALKIKLFEAMYGVKVRFVE